MSSSLAKNEQLVTQLSIPPIINGIPTFRIVSWNLNGIRAVHDHKLPISKLIELYQPDVLCLQVRQRAVLNHVYIMSLYHLTSSHLIMFRPNRLFTICGIALLTGLM
jgi:hypothetical protein